MEGSRAGRRGRPLFPPQGLAGGGPGARLETDALQKPSCGAGDDPFPPGGARPPALRRMAFRGRLVS